MQIITINGNEKTLIENKDMPHGILKCEFRHKLGDGTYSMHYGGPKIDPAEWHKVMSFFRWTNKEHSSECQVRGFIDPIDKVIRFWAFPQEARTGMSATEIANDDAKAQRLALPHSESLIYFITVHHHCGTNAFQSGGDQANEVGQDGLHITMGKMNSDHHDIDARFYLSRVKMAPKMEEFWQLSPELTQTIPATVHDMVARYQMCRKVDVEFPEQWKKNLVEKKWSSTPSGTYRGGLGYTSPYSTAESLTEKISRVAESTVEDLLRSMELDVVYKSISYMKESLILETILDNSMPERFDGMDIRNVIKDMYDLVEEELEDALNQVDTVVSGSDNGKTKETKKQRKKREKAERERDRILQQEKAELAKGGNGSSSPSNGSTSPAISTEKETTGGAALAAYGNKEMWDSY